jgi:ferredoxin
MRRKIIVIDGTKCNGCGACAAACHEGAIGMVDGKAKLLRDDYCDGLGSCLPACPTGAITFEEREAAPYDENAVRAKKDAEANAGTPSASKTVLGGARKLHATHAGCPGSALRTFSRDNAEAERATRESNGSRAAESPVDSELRQWPVQIKLAPVSAPFYEGADLLVAADCAAYAYASFHRDFIRGKVTLIGCPKLDAVDYSEKLRAILEANDIRSLTIVRMEVPCCGGLAQAATEALKASGKFIPWQIVTISTDGRKL